MADDLTGTITDGSSPSSTSEIYANIITCIRLLPHPWACLAHVGFKAAIIIAYFIFPYIFGSITGSFPDFILTFELIALLVLADYWTVKNCTASTLAGIAWYCDTSLSNQFVYKTVKDSMFLNKDETRFFWAVMYIWPAPWVLNILFRLSTINIPSLILSVLVFASAMLNLMNCLKCSQGNDAYEMPDSCVEKRTTTSQLTGKVTGKLMSLLMKAKVKESLFPH
ncbi:hypothetical protein X943_001783 [Babesia divergens]|uniref:Golgi apparatus membrane protein TVP23 homolog n=1 Tax=Babesia divergens TaxID=32595 RepID=A0AAD9GFE1_BABDI|nr:hypothetical protein X943_001783 [Babesia divergens]